MWALREGPGTTQSILAKIRAKWPDEENPIFSDVRAQLRSAAEKGNVMRYATVKTQKYKKGSKTAKDGFKDHIVWAITDNSERAETVTKIRNYLN